MSLYLPEPLPPTIIKNMLESNWSDNEGNIPIPTFMDINVDEEETVVRFDLSGGDLAVIRLDTTGIQETWRDGYLYADTKSNIEVAIYTKKNRQRLYDLMQEIRHIVRINKHIFPGYQLCRYLSFTEQNQQQVNMWQGVLRISLENAGIYIGA